MNILVHECCIRAGITIYITIYITTYIQPPSPLSVPTILPVGSYLLPATSCFLYYFFTLYIGEDSPTRGDPHPVAYIGVCQKGRGGLNVKLNIDRNENRNRH